jgi:hypothetical protein
VFRCVLGSVSLGVDSQSQLHSSGCMGLANLGSKSETCVGSRVHLVGASISFEKNFLSAPIHSPLSGSPYQSLKNIIHLIQPSLRPYPRNEKKI